MREVLLIKGFTIANIRIYCTYPYATQALAEMLKLCNTEHIESVYKFGKRLGAGAGGTVYLGTHLKTGELSAVKNIDLTSGEKKVRGKNQLH